MIKVYRVYAQRAAHRRARKAIRRFIANASGLLLAVTVFGAPLALWDAFPPSSTVAAPAPSVSSEPVAIPEPGTLALVGGGLVALGLLGLRRDR